MSIVLQGSTSGSITLQEPAIAGSTVLSLPATTGTVLTSASPSSDLPSSIKGPAFSAYASANQTVTLSTATKVAIDTENFDTNSNFDTSLYRFTPTVAGYYQVNAAVRGTAATTFTGIITYIYKNGSEIARNNIGGTLTATGTTMPQSSYVIYMNGTTDYLEVYGFISGSGTATFNYGTASATSQFSACLVRSA